MKYIQSKFHRACRHHNIKHLAYASSSSVYGNNTRMPLSTGNMLVPWNAKHIPPGVRDFTYIDDIVEGVTRVIDSSPSREIREASISQGTAQSSLDARVSEGGTTDAAPSTQHSAPYKVYNIGNSSPVPLMEYIKAVEDTLGKTAQKEFLPMQPGDVPRTEADVTDLMEDLSYKPNTPVQNGIKRFVEWYKGYFKP